MSTEARSAFQIAARITLVLVFVVMLAGSIVRTTGAGMGCPDWPKCFGHYIPPTDISELQFAPGREFKAGYFIIWKDALWKARHDLVAGPQINPDDWERYTKHDYAQFNAAHTWTEYVNRLSGATLGIVATIMVLLSLRYWRRDKLLVSAAIVTLLMIGFEAWLGAKVVESVLAPVRITMHMVAALIIVALMVWTLKRASGDTSFAPVERSTRAVLVVCLLLTVAQALMGTQVREEVDLVALAMSEANRPIWIDQLGTFFKIHRSFAIILLAMNGLLVMRLLKEPHGTPALRRKALALAGLVAIVVATGVTLAWVGMPRFAQPMHLVLASMMFGLQFDMLLDTMRSVPVPLGVPVTPTPRESLAEIE